MLGCLPPHSDKLARCLKANRVHVSLAAQLVHHMSAWSLWAACTVSVWGGHSEWVQAALGTLRAQRHGGMKATLAWHIML